MRIDLHSHTFASYDCNTSYQEYIQMGIKHKLDCVAVTDHNTIEGAMKLSEMAPFRVIVGEEIDTRDCDVIGLFLKKTIQPGLSYEETVQLIREQGGIVYLPHPASGIRDSDIKKEELEEKIKSADIVELHNARTMFVDEQELKEIEALCKKHNKIVVGGSDAHSPLEIGNCIMEVSEFSGVEDFLESLKKNKIIRFQKTTFLYRLFFNHKIRKILRRVKRWRNA